MTDPQFSKLVFEDQFNDPRIFWEAKQFTNAYGSAYFNGWDQVRSFGDGKLHIIAERGPIAGWNTGWLTTKKTVAFTPPFKYAARAKVASGAGMWSAPAWSYRNPYGGGPGGEIDDIEHLGRIPRIANQTIHWSNGSKTKTYEWPADLTAAYHVYTAKVFADRVEFLIDGKLTNKASKADTGGDWPFNNPTTFNISLDVGGPWAGPSPASLTRGEMIVDWFRVYQP